MSLPAQAIPAYGSRVERNAFPNVNNVYIMTRNRRLLFPALEEYPGCPGEYTVPIMMMRINWLRPRSTMAKEDS
jgi:hypothetical protein